MSQLNTHRVWMADGYCGLYNAQNEQEAKDKAVEQTSKDLAEVKANPKTRRLALKVRLVEKLN